MSRWDPQPRERRNLVHIGTRRTGKKRVLITIADAGSGHRSAARAITDTFEMMHPGMYDIATVDLYARADVPCFRDLASKHERISRCASLEGLLNLAMALTSTRIGYAVARRFIGAVTYTRAARVILGMEPDLVVSIHPLVSSAVRTVKEKGAHFRSAVVITDLATLFPGWADPSADLIVCPTEEAVEVVRRLGIPLEKIAFPLFPVKPGLARARPREEVLTGIGLNPHATTVLVTGGGVGTSSMVDALAYLTRDPSLQVIVVTGDLHALRVRLEERYEANKRVEVLGYVEDIQDYMCAADIALAKPGPATILELELCGTKTLFTHKIGLQETGNIRYALENPRFRYVGNEWHRLPRELISLLRENTTAAPARKSPRRFDECEEIVRRLGTLIQ